MARQTVLLVDADPRSARVFEVSLRNAGYSVTHVQSAAEAIEAIEVAIPDLVISDTRLAPSKSADGTSALGDGYSLCRRLKDDPVWYSIPFIFLTSSASIEDKIRGLELGVEDFLTKPIYLREIITRIQLVLAKKQREGMEGRTSRASFAGLLSEMGLVDLLSTIDLGRKSGVLELDAPAGRGFVFFRDGRVVDARHNRLTGAAAVYRMLLWTEGRFEIRFGPSTAPEAIELSTQGLLMEGMRRIDEWQRMREQLPPLDSVFEVDVPEVLARIGEIPDEINPILRAFDGKRTLMEVVDASGVDDLEALATLTKLYFEGLIVPAQPVSGTGNDSRVASEGELRRDTLIGFDTDVPSLLAASPSAEEGAMLPAHPPEQSATPAIRDEGDASKRSHTDALSNPSPADGTGAAILPNPSSTPPPGSAPTPQEPVVAKHRGKKSRSKREFADTSRGSISSAPTATASASVGPIDDEVDESSAKSVSAEVSSPPTGDRKASDSDASGSQPAVTEAAPSERTSESIAHDRKESVAPAASDASSSAASAVADASKPEPSATSTERPKDDSRVEISAIAEAVQAAATSTPAIEGKKDGEGKAEDSKVEGGTVIQFPRAPRVVDESKGDEKTDEKRADEKKADEKKADEKKADEKKADEKKADEKKADEKKADEKKADEKKVDKKTEKKRERKDSQGDLGEEAKAFFSDNSYEAAYKRTHDTFEDLKPEVLPEAATNKTLMYATVAILVAIVGVVGGLAIYRKYFAVEESRLPSSGSLLANDNAGGSSSSNTSSVAAGAGESDARAVASSDDDRGSSGATAVGDDAPGTSTTRTEDAAGTNVASSADNDASSAVGQGEPSGPSTGTQVVAEPSSTASNQAAADSGVAAAPSGPAELLVAAQRAQARGAAAAATAYQAYLDAGGNDGAAIARFAFWLANRNDLGRAGEWAERATQLDPNNQLAWYVLGAAKMEGPRRDPAAARAAFRRCSQLPGRYRADCQSAM